MSDIAPMEQSTFESDSLFVKTVPTEVAELGNSISDNPLSQPAAPEIEDIIVQLDLKSAEKTNISCTSTECSEKPIPSKTPNGRDGNEPSCKKTVEIKFDKYTNVDSIQTASIILLEHKDNSNQEIICEPSIDNAIKPDEECLQTENVALCVTTAPDVNSSINMPPDYVTSTSNAHISHESDKAFLECVAMHSANHPPVPAAVQMCFPHPKPVYSNSGRKTYQSKTTSSRKRAAAAALTCSQSSLDMISIFKKNKVDHKCEFEASFLRSQHDMLYAPVYRGILGDLNNESFHPNVSLSDFWLRSKFESLRSNSIAHLSTPIFVPIQFHNQWDKKLLPETLPSTNKQSSANFIPADNEHYFPYSGKYQYLLAKEATSFSVPPLQEFQCKNTSHNEYQQHSGEKVRFSHCLEQQQKENIHHDTSSEIIFMKNTSVPSNCLLPSNNCHKILQISLVALRGKEISHSFSRLKSQCLAKHTKICLFCYKSIDEKHTYLSRTPRQLLEQYYDSQPLPQLRIHAATFLTYFCNESCWHNYVHYFVHTTSNKHSRDANRHNKVEGSNSTIGKKNIHMCIQEVRCVSVDYSACSLPVLILGTATKVVLNAKCTSNNKVKLTGEAIAGKSALQGIKQLKRCSHYWKYFHVSDELRFKPKVDQQKSCDVIPLLHKIGPHLRKGEDRRFCLLCWTVGDGPEDGPGRLLNYSNNQWLHFKCALWCFDNFELANGSLLNEKNSIERAMKTVCSKCSKLGAGIGCYHPKCSKVYHLTCARDVGCTFFVDRGIYCAAHCPADVAKDIILNNLSARRRVYFIRDEWLQVCDALSHNVPDTCIRVGSLAVENVGYLLPHHINNAHFHSPYYIYPPGYRAVRNFWSMRYRNRRCHYICEIVENSQIDGPWFRVTVRESHHVDKIREGSTCDAAWSAILDAICSLRASHQLIRLFKSLLKGEKLFGLDEPLVKRVIECLPGVSSFNSYHFQSPLLPSDSFIDFPLCIQSDSHCSRASVLPGTYFQRRLMNTVKFQDSIMCPVKDCDSPFFHNQYMPRDHSAILLPFSFAPETAFTSSMQRKRIHAMHVATIGSVRNPSEDWRHHFYLHKVPYRGLGVFVSKEMEPGCLLLRFVGEVVRKSVAFKRRDKYLAQHRCIFMIRMGEDLFVDATECGSFSRYVQHSCQPNCSLECIKAAEGMHFVFVAKRRITVNEELTCDYSTTCQQYSLSSL